MRNKFKQLVMRDAAGILPIGCGQVVGVISGKP